MCTTRFLSGGAQRRYLSAVRCRTIPTLIALGLWAAGCGGGCSGGTGGASDDVVESEPREASGGERAEPEPPVDPGPPPVLRVSGEPDAHDGTVVMRIENRGTEAAEIAGAVVLQRQRGESFEDVEGVSLDLRFSCGEAAPECVTLAPGAVYLPPPWLGTEGDAQCDCERCATAEPGTYRLVVQSCNRGHTIEGDPFTR